ncbi:MAG: ATP-binding protein [Acidobacteriota bacterium]|jgi:signal transduction histidine kinase/CheY-like chemotaxis protein|nr:ATP-binding protein [Acidobacteriota bacterium]
MRKKVLLPKRGHAASQEVPLPAFLNNEVRKLKAVITLIIYGLLLLLVKTMYDTLVDVPQLSIVAIIAILAFMLAISVVLFNRFSQRAITNIVVSADRIQEARNYAESIVASVPIPLVVLSEDLLITTANPAFLSRFNYTPEETQDRPFFELDKGRWNVAELRAGVQSLQAGSGEDFHHLELEFNDPGIGHCHLLAGGRRVTVDKQPLFLLAIEDVTPRKMAEIALKERTLELEVVNRAKSEFLANMSHELRTPLNAVIGFSEVLKDGIVEGDLSPRQKEYVTDIFNSGRHLLSLINDILDMSKIDAGKMSLELEPARVSVLCESALRIIRERAAAHAIRLESVVDPHEDSLFLDMRKFRQIVYNLLSNAVKFTPDGGKVLLSARRVAAREMFRRNAQAAPNWQGDYFLELVVEDTGIGISPRDLERLFVPFEQLDGSLSRRYEGTGLGLTMVKRLAELHGGWVNVESSPGKGSRFSVFLPWRVSAETESAAVTPSLRDQASLRERSFSLFALSRNKNLCQRLQDWSQSEKLEMTVSADYAMAWDWLNRHQADAVILDAEYPGLDGIRFLIQMKELPQLQAVAVVLLAEVTAAGQGAVIAPSAFSLFPLNAASLEMVLNAAAETDAAAPAAGKRALLVDADDGRARQGVEVMRALGWEVERASSGLAGIDATLRGRPQLLITAAVLPDISGFEVIQLLAQRPETRTISTVLALEPENLEAELHAMRPGLFALLSPGGVDMEHVSRVLHHLVPGKS